MWQRHIFCNKRKRMPKLQMIVFCLEKKSAGKKHVKPHMNVPFVCFVYVKPTFAKNTDQCANPYPSRVLNKKITLSPNLLSFCISVTVEKYSSWPAMVLRNIKYSKLEISRLCHRWVMLEDLKSCRGVAREIRLQTKKTPISRAQTQPHICFRLLGLLRQADGL